jgi:hypothetical protein
VTEVETRTNALQSGVHALDFTGYEHVGGNRDQGVGGHGQQRAIIGPRPGGLSRIRGSSASLLRSLVLLGVHEWNIHDVLGHEPYLQLVAADHVAHDEIVGAVVARISGLPSHRARLLEDNLVCVQQP